MAERKTVYQLSFRPSLATLIVMIAAVASVMYLPHWLQFQIIVNPWLALAMQMVCCAWAVLFFYHGLKRVQQFQVCMVFVAIVSTLGIISNLFYQATFLITPKSLASDFLIFAMINAGALACTLTCYRFSSKKVEASELPVVQTPGHPWYLHVPPIAVSSVLFAIAVGCMINARQIPPAESFSLALPMFIAAQILFNIGGGFYFFKTLTTIERLKNGLSIMAVAMLLGTIGNTIHHATIFRAGWRISLNSSEYIIMNGGALIVVISYFYWKRFLDSRLTIAETATAVIPATQAPAPVAAAPAATVDAPQAETKETAPSQAPVEHMDAAPSSTQSNEDQKSEQIANQSKPAANGKKKVSGQEEKQEPESAGNGSAGSAKPKAKNSGKRKGSSAASKGTPKKGKGSGAKGK